MQLLYRCKIKENGITEIFKGDKLSVENIEFSILKLSLKGNFEAEFNEQETVAVILSGKCDFEIKDNIFQNVGERKNVFDGKAYAVYIPPQTKFRITAKSEEVELALAQVKTKVKKQPKLITPELVKIRVAGKENWQRNIYDIIDKDFPADKILVGETINPPGNWSSYPPHKHEVNEPPYESKHEEIYFFKVAPPEGFGLQRIYTDDGSIDEVYVIKNNDLVFIPKGYHPVVSAPGYRLCYLWVLAGENRDLIGRDDPHHSWVKGG